MKYLLWMVMLAGVLARAHAQDAGVDCANIQTWADERMCNDVELMQLHIKMQRQFDQRRRLLDGEAYKDLTSYHRGWLRGRDECRVASDAAAQLSCLKELYRMRVAQLAAVTVTPTAPQDAAPPARSEPPVMACRGDAPSWGMEISPGTARLRVGNTPTQNLLGRLHSSEGNRTYAWRGAGGAGGAETVIIVLEGQCGIDGIRTSYPLLARVSLPDGGLLSGCCQRAAPAVAPRETPAASGAGHEVPTALLAVGSKIRLRDVDGTSVSLRKSARISSGNVLTKVRAGSVAIIEQATVKEGIAWYFIGLEQSMTKGWVMGELVEPSAMPQNQSMGEAAALRRGPKEIEAGAKAGEVVPSLAPSAVPAVAPAAAESVDTQSVALAPVHAKWWANVSAHLPAIDACIQKARVRAARIVKIQARTDGGREIFLKDTLNLRIRCELQKGRVVSARALDTKDFFPRSGGPLFTRVPAVAPSAACYRNERVIDRESRAIAGWLSYPKRSRHCR